MAWESRVITMTPQGYLTNEDTVKLYHLPLLDRETCSLASVTVNVTALIDERSVPRAMASYCRHFQRHLHTKFHLNRLNGLSTRSHAAFPQSQTERLFCICEMDWPRVLTSFSWFKVALQAQLHQQRVSGNMSRICFHWQLSLLFVFFVFFLGGELLT